MSPASSLNSAPLSDELAPAHRRDDAAPDQRFGQKRILAVWTRDLDGVESVGRINTARSVRATLEQSNQLTSLRLTNHVESRSLPGLVRVFGTFLRGLASGHPIPLQCAIFAHSPNAEGILAEASHGGVVYLDGIRTLWLLRRIRNLRLPVKIIVDLDDLMSRRYAELLSLQLPLSGGYLESRLPRPVLALMTSSLVARLVLRYEGWALRDAERTVLRLANKVVLVNRHEAALLRAQGGADPSAAVEAIPPPAPVVRAHMIDAPPAPWRAVFIGTDRLPQNRLAIDFLLALWERNALGLPLVIYGRQLRPQRVIENVFHAGFVTDISEAYTPNTIVLCPTFLAGGIKTKILEGFAHGAPVVGNSASFEGLDLPNYPLCFETPAELLPFLRDPSAWREAMRRAVEIARHYVETELSMQTFQSHWASLVASCAAPLSKSTETSPPDGDVPKCG
jgi:hypothetical protein